MISSGNNPYEVELLTTQFTTVLDLLLQQKISKLRGRVDSGAHVGKMASPVQQIGVLEYKAPAGRFSPIEFQLPNYTRRWVFPTDHDVAVPVDTFDELKTIVDPKAGINMAVIAAANRFFDDLIIGAAFASASTGVDASSLQTEAWPGAGSDTASTYLIASATGAASSTGMNYPKLVEAWRILRHYQNDMEAETPCVVIGSQQEKDLKVQQEAINRDYNDKPVVEDGRITRLGGFDIVVSERLNTTLSGSNIRNCIAFVKSGLYLGLWKDMTTKIDNRQDLSSQPWQLYSMVSAGATRTQLGKIVQINCADTTGADPTAP